MEEYQMIRNIAAVGLILLLGACQPTAYPPLTYNTETADKIMQATYDVCIRNIGSAEKMKDDAEAITGDKSQPKRVRVDGQWHDIDQYRFYDGDIYLAFFSVYRNGKGCAASYASGSVPQHIATQRFGINWVEGKYEHAQFGAVRSKPVGVEYIQHIEGEGLFDMMLFLDKEWTQFEVNRTGAPDVEWGG